MRCALFFDGRRVCAGGDRGGRNRGGVGGGGVGKDRRGVQGEVCALFWQWKETMEGGGIGEGQKEERLGSQARGVLCLRHGRRE